MPFVFTAYKNGSAVAPTATIANGFNVGTATLTEAVLAGDVVAVHAERPSGETGTVNDSCYAASINLNF